MGPTLIFIHSKQLHLRKNYFKNIDIPQLAILQISAIGLRANLERVFVSVWISIHNKALQNLVFRITAIIILSLKTL